MIDALFFVFFFSVLNLPGAQEERHKTSLGKETQPAVRDAPTAAARWASGLLVAVQV